MGKGRPPKEHGPPPEREVIRNWSRLALFLGMDRTTVKKRVRDPADPLSSVITFENGDATKPQALAEDLRRYVRTSPKWDEAS